MGVKRAAVVTATPEIPLAVMAPPGVLGVLDDLSSMILGQLAIRRKLLAILETISEYIEVDCARFVLDCCLGQGGAPVTTPTDHQDEDLAVALHEYPGLLEALARGTGTVVENCGTLGRPIRDNAEGPSLCVPVCRAGGIVGMLCVSTTRGQGSFSPWEVDFCSILANMAGAVLTATS